MAASHGNTVVIVIGTHDAEDSSSLDHGFETRQENVFDFAG